MEARTKKIIGATIGLAIVSVAGYYLYKYIDKKITEKKLRDAQKKQEKENPEATKDPSVVKPIEMVQSVGKMVYPKGDGVNVRSSPNVNNGTINNLLGKVVAGKEVGKVLGSNIQGDSYVWYRVALVSANLQKTMNTNPDKTATTGYVREDNIIIK